MGLQVKQPSAIELSPEGVRINGTSEIIICSSLFYFRIPQGLWKDRLLKIKTMGYNCIDVYFPWNYHELKEGEWDFSGEKNVEQFLQEAAEAGLWIVARPGPYICSEWDGGALPAYLFAKDNLRLRDNDPIFLQHVSRWYGQIMPMLRKFQLDQGGTIIAVQLDNELDFYDCRDPKGYISALKEMAIMHKITVPLIACAGQGGLYAASGFVEDVVLSCNFYPNDKDPTFEEKVLAYGRELHSRHLPLLVTETNRSHFLLRRLLCCGTKLLGPYLQASGTNFGFTNATNNWGSPLAFLTSDYDFGGAISPEGHVREEAHEGRLLYHATQAFGDSLAEAKPEAAADSLIEVHSLQAEESSVVGPYSLSLKRGGHLLFLTNVGTDEEELEIEHCGKVFPRYSKLIAAANRSPMLPVDVPLQTWGMEGTLVYATAELARVEHHESRTLMVFHTEHEAEIGLSLAALHIETDGMQLHEQKGLTIFTFSNVKHSSAVIRLYSGHHLELIGIDRAQALLIENIDQTGSLVLTSLITPIQEACEVEVAWALSPINALSSLSVNKSSLGDHADYLEKHEIYRGYAWYESKTISPVSSKCKGILIQQASDVVSLYADGTYMGTFTPAGGNQFIDCPASLSANPAWLARTEIWGHTNFDDARLPGLRLNALKGLTGLVCVTSVKDITQNWRFQIVQTREIVNEWVTTDCDDQAWPIVGWGSWFSSQHPSFQYYRRQLDSSPEADSWTLHFTGIQVLTEVFVNGKRAGEIHPFNPYVDITPWVEAGHPISLTLWMDRGHGLPTGSVFLYEGSSTREWTLSSCQEDELLQHAESIKSRAISADLPVVLEPGEMAWLYGNLLDSNENKGWRVFCSGSHMKLSVFFNGRLVGRLWSGNGASRPTFSGGNQESFYLPGSWFRDHKNDLTIMLEAVELSEKASLDALRFVPV